MSLEAKEKIAMGSVSYAVELITQGQNPICWVASCAMVKGWATNKCIGVGGWDPSNSSIPNPSSGWASCVSLMSGWGFTMYAVKDLSTSGTMTAEDVLAAMQVLGPAVLIHRCAGFPYGPQWSAQSSGGHAVVLTSVDSDNSVVTFNNPWGDTNQPAATDPVLLIMNNDSSTFGSIFGFYLTHQRGF
jgi:hypothetical protein